jgi:general secretion pathway protein L
MTITLTPLRLDAETVAVVPAHHLSWQRVQCPQGVLPAASAQDPMGTRLRSVLDGLLEDRLLDEAAHLHFALQPPPYANEGVWVAVCDRQALAQAVQQLAGQGHVVHRLVPECAPPAQGATPLWLTGTADAPQALWADAQGVHQWRLPSGAQHASSWPAPVQMHLTHAGTVLAEPAVAAWAESALEATVQVQPTAQRLQEAALANRWNLAQGSLSLHKPWSTRIQQGAARVWAAPEWRPARWMAALLLLAQLAGINAAAWQARRQESAMHAAIDATLTRTFPQIQVVVDAPVQMQRAVAALSQSSGTPSAQDMDVMLQLFQQNLPPASANTAPTAINFEANALRLDGMLINAEQSTALAQALRSHHLALRQEGTQWVLTYGDAP